MGEQKAVPYTPNAARLKRAFRQYYEAIRRERWREALLFSVGLQPDRPAARKERT